MSKIEIPKTQHYVPRFVLRHFADDKEKIWVLDKQTGKKFKTNIINVAAENGFYNFEFDGQKETLEPSFNRLEDQASKIFRVIIKTESLSSIGDEDRLLLSRFLALQFVRTRQRRHLFRDMSESLNKLLRERGFNPDQIEGYGAEEIKLLHLYDITEADEFAPYFFNKIWVLFKTTKRQPFYISDLSTGQIARKWLPIRE